MARQSQQSHEKPEGKSVPIFGVPVTTAIKIEDIFLVEMIADYY